MTKSDAARLFAGKEGALREFRSAVMRTDDLPADEKAVALSGALLRYIKAMTPDLVSAGKLDPLFKMITKEIDAATTDVHGGADAGLTRETLMIHLGAIADVLVATTGISARRACRRVAAWSGDTVGWTSVQKWTASGSNLRVSGHEDRLDAAALAVEKLNHEIDRVMDDPAKVEVFLKARVTAIVRRLR